MNKYFKFNSIFIYKFCLLLHYYFTMLSNFIKINL